MRRASLHPATSGRRRKKWPVLVLAAVAILLLTGMAWRYLAQHSMLPAASSEHGLPSSSQRVLIATQGSVFKDTLIRRLVSRLASRQMYVRVIDVGALADAVPSDWQVVVIVHTWEFGRAPRAVTDFVARIPDPRRIVDVTTSGGGREKLPGVDVISSASVMTDVPGIVAKLDAKITALLQSP